MSSISAGINLRVGGLFASHFFGFGLFLPFFPLVLEGRGLSLAEIGYVLGIGTIVRIAANPIMTGLSDRSGRRRLSIFVYSLAGGGFLGFFMVSSGPMTALIAVAGLMAFWSPIVPLSDAYALDVVRNTGADYARMRLWGSVGFVVANLGGGFVSGIGSNAVIPIVLIVSVIATGLVAISLPPQDGRRNRRPGEASSPVQFRQPWFWLLLLLGGMLQGTHAAFYSFGTLYWRDAGVADWVIGVLWSIGVMAEIALFAIAGRLGLRYGPLAFLMAAAVAGVVRWGLFPFADTVIAMAVLQLLHGLSFGAAHLGIVNCLSRVVAPKWAATGQGFLAASVGIQMAVGMAVSGPLFEIDPDYPFWAMAISALVALMLLILSRPLLERRMAETEAAARRAD